MQSEMLPLGLKKRSHSQAQGPTLWAVALTGFYTYRVGKRDCGVEIKDCGVGKKDHRAWIHSCGVEKKDQAWRTNDYVHVVVFPCHKAIDVE